MIKVVREIAKFSAVPNYAEDPITNLGIFPSLKTVRNRGSYRADENTLADETCRDDCKKWRKTTKKLSPGVFTLFCGHGICYGFQIMDHSESPNVPFTILRTKFESIPQLVVYDNACRLHTYALRRDPQLFRDTKFLIDRFHWPNHTNCPAVYCLNSYPDLSSLNSQVTEQTNSSLSRIRTQLAYMTLDNFIIHARLYLFLRNMPLIQSVGENYILNIE